ncbi:hypothetical protein NGR_b05260 (plasmid) [Sinorhizobium fredii NGR234]|uniref:DUF2726 domain-containing protein n=1 Tax=Sinorhizobium fredii (strain NBRC 101917 / NGR234) TaxID=394 RepID=Q6W1C0_SINFN|nr:DUF2726 domain-containing protein [Sinorhizobium fredii]AAQ87448.1 Hypothetical protein RNGR00323 [Sinorhizobium fredii NGR234]ACP21985.1 hypothetical protein NGR_b05260 [Sinorhizobium fredii NGR234]
MHYRQKSVLFAAPWLVVGLVAVVVSGGMTVSDFEKPELLVAALFVGVIVGMAVEQCLSAMRRQAWRANTRWQEKRGGASIVTGPWLPALVPEPPKKPDAAEQLRIVMGANFTIQPLLNKSEARVFKELDRVVMGCNPTWQVMAQVSMGEIIRSKDPVAHSCINSKRVDLLLVDGNCQPRHAIEYQGGAHHQGAAAARDAIKKEALRRAGIGYHEVVAGQTTPAELRRLIEKLVEKPNVN